jgi:hypothetical protein
MIVRFTGPSHRIPLATITDVRGGPRTRGIAFSIGRWSFTSDDDPAKGFEFLAISKIEKLVFGRFKHAFALMVRFSSIVVCCDRTNRPRLGNRFFSRRADDLPL